MQLIKGKGVDADGFIRTLADRPVQWEMRAVVDGLRGILTGQLAHLVDSAYLYGSVARADAVAGRSDLDVVLVLTRTASLQDAAEIEHARLGLEQSHREVSKVDFDIGTLAEVNSPENFERWGFWLKHHCRCIHGEDRSRSFPLFRPSVSVARAVNGDFPDVLAAYARRIEAETDAVLVARLIKEAARKAIRATNVLRPVDFGSWPESIEDHVRQFVCLFPKMAQEIAFFVSQQQAPQCDPADFSRRLRRHAAWMQQHL